VYCNAGKPVKATFGTTKYCNSFLKGVRCQNADCLYLHDIGELMCTGIYVGPCPLIVLRSTGATPDMMLAFAAELEDSYTKEETKSAKFVQLVNAATIAKQPASSQKEGTSGLQNGQDVVGRGVFQMSPFKIMVV
jgi:CCR4-NOT transcription complex subunit 4